MAEALGGPTRQAEVQAGLAAVEERVARACAAAGRPRADVHVVVVTKTFPASDVRLLASLGVRDVGESRDQEAAPKAAECADLDLRWHFVGRLQTNKAASVAGYCATVHSVDRLRLVTALSRGATRTAREVACLVQVNLDTEPDAARARGGAPPAQVPELADAIARAEGLRLLGVMGVAPLGGDPHAAFEQLAEVAQRLRQVHPGATAVSAGMSGDLEVAVACGATHLRVGSAVLGSRPPLQ
jgi:pyridoxal phosphate enzyme (YggS family)